MGSPISEMISTEALSALNYHVQEEAIDAKGYTIKEEDEVIHRDTPSERLNHIANSQVRFPKLSLAIKEKVIYEENIHISPSTIKMVHRRYSYQNEHIAGEQFTYKILKGTYIGDCTVLKYNRIGHLIQVEEHFYVVLSMDNFSAFYVSTSLNDYKMFEEIENTMVVIDGVEKDASEIEMGYHFTRQASERLKVAEGDIQPLFLDTVVNGRYITITRCKEDRSPAHLFCKDGRLVYVSLDLEKAITIYSNRTVGSSMHDVVKEKLIDTLMSEIKKLNVIENKLNKRNEKEQLYDALRIAEINIEIYHSRAINKIEALEQELKDIDQKMHEMDAEWGAVVDDIRRHAIALASFF